jgi:hypothetical protein
MIFPAINTFMGQIDLIFCFMFHVELISLERILYPLVSKKKNNSITMFSLNNFSVLVVLLVLFCVPASSQQKIPDNAFEQLGSILPSPNSYRTASGAPGSEYWQQRADYHMKIRLDEKNKRIYGEETIIYFNNSPDDLSYLWLQLDQNKLQPGSDSHLSDTSSYQESMSVSALEKLMPSFEGGFHIEEVAGEDGQPLPYVINKTMMRINLPDRLSSGEKLSFSIRWWYNINDTNELSERSGYESFSDNHEVFVIAQFYPRMCAYNDLEGWQNKQFLGRGEFTLSFGDYVVEITVPGDHVVASTGVLKNAEDVLNKTQRNRIELAESSHVHPVLIRTFDEVQEAIANPSEKEKTWTFSAENVRDFAFASSRRFLWDAMGVPMKDDRIVMAQSMWVPEGDCLWSKFSTKAIAHTIKWYSHYTFDYPYPVAWSVDGDMGMEYPMISFNYGRCHDDGTYTKRMKYGHIGVIIHEVGHNWFPMIVNSDERQWTWMDEGLNSFLQYLTEQQWERNFPSRRGEPSKITAYMGGDKSRISPIMSNSENIFQFGNNAYNKPATALNILRETIMGRDLFDFAFKEYANRWAFKQPYPADFFRTMEDASGVDLDWFWRGWFYSNEHVDQSIVSFEKINIDGGNPIISKESARQDDSVNQNNLSRIRNMDIQKTYDEIDTTIRDFYTTYDPFSPDAIDEENYQRRLDTITSEEIEFISENLNYYEIQLSNEGGVIMPIIIQFAYEDGTTEDFRLPAEIWRYKKQEVSKIFPVSKEVVEVRLDPYLEIADVDTYNNFYPRRPKTSRFKIFKKKNLPRRMSEEENEMQRAKRAANMVRKETKP